MIAGLWILLAAGISNQAGIPRVHVALVVGSNIGDLDEEPLRYAVSDARKVAEVLLDTAGAEVSIVTDPNPEVLQRHLERVAARTAELRRNRASVLLSFYFAGHADKTHLHLSGRRYPIERLQRQLDQAQADLTMLVTDACRGHGGARSRGLARVDVPEVNMILPPQAKGTIWIHATGSGTPAQESDRLQGGVFTHYWISGLRGAADVNTDGQVTLAEAYSYAASHTHGFSATSPDGPQWPAYRFDLAGAMELVLAQTRRAPSLVSLPPGRQVLYIVRRWPSGSSLLDVPAKEREPLEVALPAGRFQVIRRRPDRVEQALVHLPWGGQSQLKEDDFTPVEDLGAVVRGGERGGSQLWSQLVTGLEYEPHLPLVWQRLRFEFGYRPGGEWYRWLLFASVGWQGHRFDLDDIDKYIRSDSLLIAIGAYRSFEIGALSLLLGGRLGLEWVQQREYYQDADRARRAALPNPYKREAFRLAEWVQVCAHAPLGGRLVWVFQTGFGLILERGRGDKLEVAPALEITTGPGLWW